MTKWTAYNAHPSLSTLRYGAFHAADSGNTQVENVKTAKENTDEIVTQCGNLLAFDILTVTVLITKVSIYTQSPEMNYFSFLWGLLFLFHLCSLRFNFCGVHTDVIHTDANLFRYNSQSNILTTLASSFRYSVFEFLCF